MSAGDPNWPRASEWLARGAGDPVLIVMGVPTAAASISGSDGHLTPQRFREVLGRFSTFGGENGIDLESLAVTDFDDLDVATLDMQASQGKIASIAEQCDPTRIWAFIGGDNAITRPLVAGLAGGGLPGDLSAVGVLTFDAHHDVRDLGDGPTNGTPIRGLIEDGLPGENVAQIGIHSFANSAVYRRYCDDHGIQVFTMAEVDAAGIVPVVSSALDHLVQRAEWIYVDFDIDVLDSAYAPGCPGSRPGGMTPRQLAAGAFLCGQHPAVRAADFVEVDPTRDRNDITLMNLANTFLSFAAGLAAREVA